MASIIKVDKLDPQSGTALEIGSSGDTINVPSGATLDINSGATLTNNGTATGFAGIAWQSVVTAATLTAVAGRGYPINTTSNACTVTLPAAASVGDQIIFTDYARNWNTYAVTINQNSLKYQGYATPNPVYDTNGESIHIVYVDATQGWVPINDGAVAFETPQTYSSDFLVIAGGGGGGYSYAGGGGAGGYRNSYNSEASGGGGASESALVLTIGTAYTITVGDGGAGGSTGAGIGIQGSAASITGSDITDITTVGGGAGGYNIASNLDTQLVGGSGGGAGAYNTGTGGAGTANQGYGGGAGHSSDGGGGGGGASAVGVNYSGGGGNGGAGLSSSITGSAIARGGGGGAGSWTSVGPVSSGGTGGGGNGAYQTGNPTVGAANTGGGGGGAGLSPGAAGGKGVVILRMPDANYSGTTTGSPTVATGVSGDTVLTFNASGSYTG